MLRVKLDHTEEVAQNIRTFWFQPETPVEYMAGQFIELFLPHDNPDKRGQKHWFTLSSSPSEKLISITTKHATDQVSTFKQTLFNLRPGAVVKMAEPMGDFVLPKDVDIPLVFVAAGMGITPMRSIVKWLSDTGEKRRIELLYATKTAEELAFIDLFESYGIVPQIILSNPPKSLSGRTFQIGHLSSGLILGSIGRSDKSLLYISGPEPMIEQLEGEILASGLPSRRLVLDFFPGYLPI